MTSPFFSKSVVAEMQPEQQSQNINISDNIMHTTLPAEVVRNILDLTGETMWYDSVIDWKFDNVNNSDSAPRLINVLALPITVIENNNLPEETQEELSNSWHTATNYFIDNKWCACKFDLAQCYRMLMPHRYRNLYNVRRSLVDQTTNTPVIELKNGMYESLQYVEEEESGDKNYSSKPMMSTIDILKFMSSYNVLKNNSRYSKEFGFLKEIEYENIGKVKRKCEDMIDIVQGISAEYTELKRKKSVTGNEQHAAIDKDLKKLKKDAEVLRDNLLLSRLTNIVSDKI